MEWLRKECLGLSLLISFCFGVSRTPWRGSRNRNRTTLMSLWNFSQSFYLTSLRYMTSLTTALKLGSFSPDTPLPLGSPALFPAVPPDLCSSLTSGSFPSTLSLLLRLRAQPLDSFFSFSANTKVIYFCSVFTVTYFDNFKVYNSITL